LYVIFTFSNVKTSCGDKGLDSSKFKKEIVCLQTQHLDMLWGQTKMQQPVRVASVIVDTIFSTNNPPRIIIDHFKNRIQWFFMRVMEPFFYNAMAAYAYKYHLN
jgi:hypothetical protein